MSSGRVPPGVSGEASVCASLLPFGDILAIMGIPWLVDGAP